MSASRLAAAGASVREIALPEEFSRLYHASRETINNYERSKRMAADWATHGARISKVLGDRIKHGMAMQARGLRRGACSSPNTAARCIARRSTASTPSSRPA